MKTRLLIQAVTKLLCGVIITGLLIFLPAGTIYFTNGWLLMGLLFVPMFATGIVMMLKKPELLKKRLSAREKLKEQKTVVRLSALMFVAGFIVAGLTVRFKWCTFPRGVVLIATVIFLTGYALYAEVLRENTYLSRTIEVDENQKVIDTGLYGIVRHPMYSATLLMFITMPMILGSIYSFFVFLTYPFIIAKRMKNEEAFLERKLVGYHEYKKKVKYRLLPLIW